MKTYIIEDTGLNYPVGHHIELSIKYVNNLFHTFKTEILPQYHNIKYVNIWCRGSSGAILASLFSVQINSDPSLNLKYKIQHVKKDGEQSHSDGIFISSSINEENNINIIIDDFMATGATIYYILEAIPVEHKYNMILMVLDTAISKKISVLIFKYIDHVISSQRGIYRLSRLK